MDLCFCILFGFCVFITERVSEAKVLTFDSERATVTQG
jgi:hypothetical protein